MVAKSDNTEYIGLDQMKTPWPIKGTDDPLVFELNGLTLVPNFIMELPLPCIFQVVKF